MLKFIKITPSQSQAQLEIEISQFLYSLCVYLGFSSGLMCGFIVYFNFTFFILLSSSLNLDTVEYFVSLV